jgi:D-3-phosphoglycerate dehydrogenase
VLFKEIGVLEPVFFSEKAINTLRRIGNVSLYKNGNISSFLKDKEILFIRLKYYIDSSFLNNAPALKYICSPCTGLTHLKMEDIQSRNIKVFSLKDKNNFLFKVRATPEHLIGLTISLIRNYKSCFCDKKKSIDYRYNYLGEELYKNKVGIIGFGRVGKILACYFKSFGAKVSFYDINPRVQELPGTKKMNSIEKVIKSSNIIVLCASYNNKIVLNKNHIDMLNNKYFINGARGELIDEDYLIKKIKENTIKGVALDVISNESICNNNSIIFASISNKKNFIHTPHIGGATRESLRKTEEFLSKNVVNYFLNKD